MFARLFQLLKMAATAWSEDSATRLSAAISYYSIFSLGPLLLVAISIAGAIYGEEAARGAVQDQLAGAMGNTAAAAVQSMVASTQKSGAHGLMALVGIVLLLVTASGVFAQLKDALNIVWGIKIKSGRGIAGYVKNQFYAISMVLVIGFLLMVSLLLSAVLEALNKYVGDHLPIPAFAAQAIAFAVSFGVVTALFALIFKVLPDANVEWRDVWSGAALTSLLFNIGKLGLAIYLGREGADSTYGAAGALVLVLLWVNYSSLILLYGAEFTQVCAQTRGHQIVPKPYAELISTAQTTPKAADETAEART